jgi:hypothetical protein
VYRAALADGLDEVAAGSMAPIVGGTRYGLALSLPPMRPVAPIFKIMEQARHARFETTRSYIREADAFRDNAASYLGL